MSLSDGELTAALAAFITERTGTEARVESLCRLAGGASRLSYGFKLCSDRDQASRDGREMVLRLDRASAGPASDRSQEFAVMAAAHRAGVRVPAVHWMGSSSDGLGGDFIVMEHVTGQALPRRLLRDERFAHARQRLPEQLAGELARAHGVALDDAGLVLSGQPASGGAGAEVARYLELFGLVSGGRPQPAVELVGRWLAANGPVPARTTLVHGDFRVGNFMFDDDGLVAVLDWELAHPGDPLEDIGWLSVRSWRFGNEETAVGGLCSRAQFARLYEDAAGVEVDRDAVAYWELFGNWKWAVICMAQAASYSAGPWPDVELAAIGRRVAEVEWEMLALLDDIERAESGGG